MKFEFPEINKVCFETECIADSNFDGDIKVGIDENANASNIVI